MTKNSFFYTVISLNIKWSRINFAIEIIMKIEMQNRVTFSKHIHMKKISS